MCRVKYCVKITDETGRAAGVSANAFPAEFQVIVHIDVYCEYLIFNVDKT